MRKMFSAAILAVVLAVPGVASADDKSFLKKAIKSLPVLQQHLDKAQALSK